MDFIASEEEENAISHGETDFPVQNGNSLSNHHHQEDNTSNGNRPFLSYSNFKKMSQDREEGEEENAEEAFQIDANGGIQAAPRRHTIYRVIKHFPDGRVWVELGGHELLLACNGEGDAGGGGEAGNAEEEAIAGGEWAEEEEAVAILPQSNGTCFSALSTTATRQPHHHHHQLNSCIFATKKPFATSRMRSLSMAAHPERMPFADFCRQFCCLLPAEEKLEIGENARECARRILQHANVPEHRYRLGLSQILLQSETLVHLEGMRSAQLVPAITAFQAHCRAHLLQKQLDRRERQSDAVRIIQESMRCWQEFNGWHWWRLFTQIRPLLPLASMEEKERHWREQLAQLDTELDEMRSQLSCAQLELESTRKAKAMADEWGQQMQRKNGELAAELEKAQRQRGTVPQAAMCEIVSIGRHQTEENESGALEEREQTMDLKRELNETLERAHCAEQKAQKALQQLSDAEGELEDLRRKNERSEKRQKSLHEELAAAREQVDSLLEEKDRLERQLKEASMKEARKGSEMRKELEAREAEMEATRVKNQRQIHELEAQLEQAKAEVTSLNKQKMSAFQQQQQQRTGGSLGSSSPLFSGSLSDLAQSNSLLNTNRALKRKLSKALALLHTTQTQLANSANSAEKNALIRTLRQQLELAEGAELHARRAQLTAESELGQLKTQLENATNARIGAEQKLMHATREKNAAAALARDHEEQMKEALKRERRLIERLSLEQIQLRTQLDQISQLERELRAYKTGSRKQSDEMLPTANANLVERQKLDLVELKLRDAAADLDYERAQRRHMEALLNQLKHDFGESQQQLQEACAAKDKEMEAQKQLRRENTVLEQRLNEAKRRETDIVAKHKAAKRECILLDEEQRSYAVDLKMAYKRLEILQIACIGDASRDKNAGAATGILSISSMSGGSELGDLDEMLLGEEEEGGVAPLKNMTKTIIRDSPEFDGSHSDTAEGSSSSTGEHANGF